MSRERLNLDGVWEFWADLEQVLKPEALKV